MFNHKWLEKCTFDGVAEKLSKWRNGGTDRI